MSRFVAIAVALAAGVSIVACGESSSHDYSRGVYFALGDSISAGNGSSDKNATSFVADLASDEHVGDRANLAVAGATTQDVIDKQLDAAIAAMKVMPPAFITISAGGNDLAALIPNQSCQEDPLPASCPLDDALAKVEANFNTIMQRLRDAQPKTPIVLLLYPSFFSGTGHPFEAPAGRVLPRLDEVIARVAKRYQHTGVAKTAAAFEGNGASLTHVLDAQFDPHPNDAGHRLIADAFVVALKGID